MRNAPYEHSFTGTIEFGPNSHMPLCMFGMYADHTQWQAELASRTLSPCP